MARPPTGPAPVDPVTAWVMVAAVKGTAVVSSVNPSAFGQSVTFTVTVSPKAPGSGTPTGTVIFIDGSTVLEGLSGDVVVGDMIQAVVVGSKGVDLVAREEGR